MNQTKLKRLYKKVYAECLVTMLHYGGTEEHLQERLPTISRILTAQSPEEADLLCRKALGSIEMYIFSLWSKRKIPGPNTPLSIEIKAKKAESLAKYLDKKSLSKYTTPEEAVKLRVNAEKQRGRAAALHISAKEARKPKEAPCPPESNPTSSGLTDIVTVLPFESKVFLAGTLYEVETTRSATEAKAMKSHTALVAKWSHKPKSERPKHIKLTEGALGYTNASRKAVRHANRKARHAAP